MKAAAESSTANSTIAKSMQPRDPRLQSRNRRHMALLYRPEPERKAWLQHEGALCNLSRKLTEKERITVYCFAERLVLQRIANRRLR